MRAGGRLRRRALRAVALRIGVDEQDGRVVAQRAGAEREHGVLQGAYGARGRGARTRPQRLLDALHAEQLARALSTFGNPVRVEQDPLPGVDIALRAAEGALA